MKVAGSLKPNESAWESTNYDMEIHREFLQQLVPSEYSKSIFVCCDLGFETIEVRFLKNTFPELSCKISRVVILSNTYLSESHQFKNPASEC